MIEQMAIAIASSGFNDLGLSVTLICFLMGHFLYRFSTLSEKSEETLSIRSLNFRKMLYRIPLFFALHLFVRRFQMPLEGLSFVKTLVKFGIIYAKDPLLQNMLNYVPQFFKIRVAFLTLYL